MPIYEYRCQDCGTNFEKLVRNGVTVDCPSCGQDHLEQQYSTFAARAESGGTPNVQMGGCASGMCQTPGLCGRNN